MATEQNVMINIAKVNNRNFRQHALQAGDLFFSCKKLDVINEYYMSITNVILQINLNKNQDININLYNY